VVTMGSALGIMLLISVAASAQSEDRALQLLRLAESSAQEVKSWRAEITETGELTGKGMNLHDETHVTFAVQSPGKMLRRNSGDDVTMTVCDGNERFYSGDGHSFYRSQAAVGQGCSYSLTDYYQLEANPISVRLVGRDHVQLNGGPVECELVQAEWNRDAPGVPARLHTVRTMCIDPARYLILRDHKESTDVTSDLHSVETKVLTSYESNPKFPLGTFELSVPTGTMQAEPPSMSSAEPLPVNGIYPMGTRVPYPRLVSKIEPSYTEDAIQARMSGLVLVSLTVAPDGTPQNMKVVRGLGHGLDEKAIEAVGRWHFDPVRLGSEAIAVGPLTVALNFQLP
jgi:TonB family protein